MQMSYSYASDFPFKNFRKLSAQHTETIRKNVWKKSYDLYSLSIIAQTTINHISSCFLPQYQRQRIFFQSARTARTENSIARHIDARSVVCGWDLVTFDWFVLSMRMQVIRDSSFARPGSAAIGGGKKGEFRDWTKRSRARREWSGGKK